MKAESIMWSAVAAAAVLVWLLTMPLLADVPATQASVASSGDKIVIALAGDSTVTDVAGWAPGFEKRLLPPVEVHNLSMSGRSSKSYRAEGHWAKVLALKPDYVIIQFGHNDMPGKGAARETDPKTTYTQNMKQYVEDARAAGIKPILVTSIARREFRDDGKIHSTLIPWVDAVKQVAADEHVPLLDMHQRTIELYESIGPAGCDALSPVKDGKIDHTHLNAKGGDVIGGLAIEALRTAVPELAQYIVERTASTNKASS